MKKHLELTATVTFWCSEWCLTHKAKFGPPIINLAGVVQSKNGLAICKPNPTAWDYLT